MWLPLCGRQSWFKWCPWFQNGKYSVLEMRSISPASERLQMLEHHGLWSACKHPRARLSQASGWAFSLMCNAWGGFWVKFLHGHPHPRTSVFDIHVALMVRNVVATRGSWFSQTKAVAQSAINVWWENDGLAFSSHRRLITMEHPKRLSASWKLNAPENSPSVETNNITEVKPGWRHTAWIAFLVLA